MSTSPTTDSVTPEQAQEISKQVATYVKVGLVSVVFTCLTVALSFVTHGNILVAMILAACNGLIILCYTMHLKSEKSSIVRTAWICLFFFAEMLLVNLLAYSDRIHL